MKNVAKIQIGKVGVNAGVINALNNALKSHSQIRISMLKSSGRSKENMETLAGQILEKLNFVCFFRIIGFTIILSKSHAKKLKK